MVKRRERKKIDKATIRRTSTMRGLAKGDRPKAKAAGKKTGDPKPVRVGVYMDRKLFRDLKIAAAERGETISALVTQGVESILGK